MPYNTKEKTNAAARRRYAENPEVRAKHAAARAAQMADPEKLEARRAYAREYSRANKDKMAAYAATRRAANPELYDQQVSERNARWRAKNTDKTRALNAEYRAQPKNKLTKYLLHILTKYGLTPQDFYGMVQEQAGLCANPGCTTNGERTRLDDKSSDTKVCVDHCHEKGHVRRLLCNPCNQSLGRLRESKARVQGLASLL